MASNGTTTAYDAAIAAASTQAEKDRLQDLRLRFNTPPDSPEWQFYAVMAPLIAMQQKKAMTKTVEPKTAALIYALVFAAAIFVTDAISMLALPSSFSLSAAFALGISATLAFFYLFPVVASLFQRNHN